MATRMWTETKASEARRLLHEVWTVPGSNLPPAPDWYRIVRHGLPAARSGDQDALAMLCLVFRMRFTTQREARTAWRDFCADYDLPDKWFRQRRVFVSQRQERNRRAEQGTSRATGRPLKPDGEGSRATLYRQRARDSGTRSQ
jgi:hypothetical protein